MTEVVVELRGVELVVFDFDNTLADSAPVHRAARLVAFREHNMDVPADINAYGPLYGSSGEVIIAKMLEAAGYGTHLDEQLIQSILFAKDAAFLELAQQSVPAKPGAVNLAKLVAERNIEIALNTDSRDAIVIPFLEREGLTEIFDPALRVTREVMMREGLAAKPARDGYDYLIKLAHVHVAPRTLVIEDSPDGAVSAHAAGASLLVVNNMLTPADFAYYDPEYFVNSLEEVRIA